VFTVQYIEGKRMGKNNIKTSGFFIAGLLYDQNQLGHILEQKDPFRSN